MVSRKKPRSKLDLDENTARQRYALTRHELPQGAIPTVFLPPDGKQWHPQEVKFADDGSWVCILWTQPIY